ncbi:MAG: hypothetical protein ACE5EA_04410 [Nitrospirota bacterium]
MCTAIEKICKCGKSLGVIHNADSILPYEVVISIYCPECSSGVEYNKAAMIEDNGWVIEYDMEIAKNFAQKIGISEDRITPEFLFENNYSSWNGYYPTDIRDKAVESQEILKIAKVDPKRYLSEIRNWTEQRIKRLSSEGWRKAKMAEAEI